MSFVSEHASVGRSTPLHPLGRRGREGCDPLALSRGLFWRKLRFPTMQAVFEEFCFRRRGRGALRSPTAPRGRGGERAARPLELSADGCSAGVLFSDEAGGAVLLMALVSDGAGRGALRSPTAPRGRDTRGLRCPLELSVDGCSAEVLFSDEAGGAVLLLALVSDGTGVGHSAPLQPLGDGGREGCDPLALSRGRGGGDDGFWWGGFFSRYPRSAW